MKFQATEEWTEVPFQTVTIQAVGGSLEVEVGASSPTEKGSSIYLNHSEKVAINSTEKVWVRALGTNVTCLYGGF